MYNNNNLQTLITDMTDDFNIGLPADLIKGEMYIYALAYSIARSLHVVRGCTYVFYLHIDASSVFHQ